MKNKMLMKTAAFLLVFTGLTAAAFGQITISGGLALSQLDASNPDLQDLEAGIGIGANVYLDYLLPLSFPLSLGGEIGLDSASLKSPGAIDVNETIMAVPLLVRAAYHFDLMPKLDLYVVGKLGIVFGIWSGSFKNMLEQAGGKIEIPPAVSFGFDAGAAYYFTPLLGVFLEAGFDRYNLEAKASASQLNYNYTIKAPFNRFVTFGISTKF
jgi:hypothetical protein